MNFRAHTPGGLVLASLQIARAIHKHKGKVTAIVPHYAMSGGPQPVRRQPAVEYLPQPRRFQGGGTPRPKD